MKSVHVNVSDKIKIQFEDESLSDIEGTVTNSKNEDILASFDLNWEGEIARHKCTIEFQPNDIVYNRKLEALGKLTNLNDDLKGMLCKKYLQKQIIPNIELEIPQEYIFNESQKKAIRMAISNPFSLIQGPPGTRKTHTIGAIAIQSLYNELSKKVLICGTTNVSIISLIDIVGEMIQSHYTWTLYGYYFR